MGGSLGAKSFPWPTAIGNSPNVTPLTQAQAPSLNGPNNSMTPGSPAGSPTLGGATMTMPNAPNAPTLPVGPAPYRPISSPVASRQMSPFYGR